MAAPLLIEPRLSKIHQASLHLLLSSCSDEVVRHAEEAVRLYGEFLQDHEFTPEQRADVVKLQDAAEDTLKRARDDQAAMERDFDQALLVSLPFHMDQGLTYDFSPSGEIMSDEQFKALQERELLAPEDDEKAGVKDNGSE